MRKHGLIFGFFALISLSASGCSTVMEATRPDPVDLDRFRPGDARIDVIGEVGTPLSLVKDQDRSCDVYKLYTRGPGAWGKAGIALGEAAADVFTLGLAEVVTTPGEAATRNSLHTVLFCYGADDKLALVRESETHVDGEPSPAVTNVVEAPRAASTISGALPPQPSPSTANSERACTEQEESQKRIAIENGYTMAPNCQ